MTASTPRAMFRGFHLPGLASLEPKGHDISMARSACGGMVMFATSIDKLATTFRCNARDIARDGRSTDPGAADKTRNKMTKLMHTTSATAILADATKSLVNSTLEHEREILDAAQRPNRLSDAALGF